MNADVLKNTIVAGVAQGLFGIGNLDEKGKLICRYFKQEIEPLFADRLLDEDVVLIKDSICREQKKDSGIIKESPLILQQKVSEARSDQAVKTQHKTYSKITLKLKIPAGELSKLANTVFYLTKVFKEVSINVDIKANFGEITIDDYEDKIREAFNQSNIKIEEEKLE